MKRFLVVIAALLFPLLLGGAAFWVSSRSLTPAVSSVPLAKGALATPQPRNKVVKPADKKDRNNTDDAGDETETAPGDDVSGNCDEAEHASDPECSGGSPSSADDEPDDDDNSGPSGGDDDDRDDDDKDDKDDDKDDNSGSGSDNSGSGSDDDPEDD